MLRRCQSLRPHIIVFFIFLHYYGSINQDGTVLVSCKAPYLVIIIVRWVFCFSAAAVEVTKVKYAKCALNSTSAVWFCKAGATDASSEGEDLDRSCETVEKTVKKRKKEPASKLSCKLTKALKKTRLSHDSSISPDAYI